MTDILFFWSGSADVLPGKGVNEQIQFEYKNLSKIKDWRKKLSNFWISPIEIDGLIYNTVEHYFQCQKLALADKKISKQLQEMKGNGLEAKKMRKAAILSNSQLKEWENIKNDVMYRALVAKFTQHKDLEYLLLCTDNAQLWHGCRGTPKSRQNLYEKVRKNIIKSKV